ncbi:TonB-dependent receptor [Bizionia sediminis]|uniref:TonB-dependent receptor n=1 Tax=Bizionia sediminis TaxID=1737064 RepID=A0ABW5KU03_9FLAO
MRKHIYFSFTGLCLFSTLFSWAQERENDTLNTNVINVVKPYTPTISDAFKVKETPVLDDGVTTAKKAVDYTIFSIPVASTFTPAKGKAAVLDKQKAPKLFDNYANLAFGSYTSVLADLYLNHAISRTENIGGYLQHQSAQGGINNLLLDDAFYNTKLQANYEQINRNLKWDLNLGGLHQVYNWHGMQQPYFNETDAKGVDAGHTFYGANLGGSVQLEDAYLSKGEAHFQYFGDDYGSAENHFKAKLISDVTIKDYDINTQLTIDYLGGSFDRNYFNSEAINYGNFNIGLAPSYQLVQEDLSVNLGVSVVYLNDTEASESNVYIYPNIAASYRLVDELLLVYGGIEGGLTQNTYYSVSQENPFVSPTLLILPTNKQYDAYVGLKGKISSNMGYDVKASYRSEKNKQLFKNNLIPYDFTRTEAYQYGNSYGLVYDKITTLSVGGKLQVDLNQDFTLALTANYFIYNTDAEAEAWNLPNMKASLMLDYQITNKWFAGANLFFEGERQAVSGFAFANNPANPIFTNNPLPITLDGFLDANAHVGYRVNNRLDVYAKVNNLANQSYHRWLNYPVQTFQALVGASYKFDF